jgi:hypothetical protein
MHDRDDAAGAPIEDKHWPEGVNFLQPSTWGQLAFGLPTFQAPPGAQEGTVTIRHKLNGATVVDGAVGGSTNCGKGLDSFFAQWGEKNYAGVEKVNVQNQYDVSDWPCFSKIYIDFPLNSVPAGKSILSATFTIYQFSNAGGGEFGIPPGSFIQVSTVNEAWDEATLTWNNAPQAMENISRTWVDWIDSPVPWPGIAREWDVSRAALEAYSAGQPLRLVLYSADGPRHSGKYFISSDTGDWNEAGRPALQVTWGSP